MSTPPPLTTEVLKVNPDDIIFPPDAEQPTLNPTSATAQNLERAAELLRKHTAPVAFPTETVYGLGAAATSTAAVRQIFAAKQRPSDNPLIVHVSSVAQLRRVLGIEVPQIYRRLVDKFWPGPLTIILPLPRGTVVSPACTPGQTTVGVRMPAHPVARALIAISDTPLAAPSANASTKPSPTTAAHVLADMAGRIPLVLDGGSCSVGVESTVVDGTVRPPAVLRPGGVSVEMIREVGGEEWKDVVVGKSEAGKHESVRTPGMKYRHYSPRARVIVFVGAGEGGRVVKEYLERTESSEVAVLTSKLFETSGWDDSTRSRIKTIRSLGTTGADIARNLFAGLRDADEELQAENSDNSKAVILVEGVSDDDEGAAIMNRLRKAASEIYEDGEWTVKESS
ncbi:DHBP synthase RibB-like alpha/beta domain-containing protein [Myxozyma melibiosi]|uniref:Threonylcarbamoyl-AMP synthase n=1 Tax=Myxozyma melibiosi TaxID=54550 RepID=A0ABR1F159_9ASCO